MQSLQIAEKVSVAAVAAQAGQAIPNATPFMLYRSVLVNLNFDNATAGAPVVEIQTAPDNATWTTVFTSDGSTANQQAVIELDAYIRTNVTTAGSAGVMDVYLTGE